MKMLLELCWETVLMLMQYSKWRLFEREIWQEIYKSWNHKLSKINMKISFAMNEKKMWPSANLWVIKSDDRGYHVKNLQYLGKIINIAPAQNSN